MEHTGRSFEDRFASLRVVVPAEPVLFAAAVISQAGHIDDATVCMAGNLGVSVR
jgi:hypothetical protein